MSNLEELQRIDDRWIAEHQKQWLEEDAEYRRIDARRLEERQLRDEERRLEYQHERQRLEAQHHRNRELANQELFCMVAAMLIPLTLFRLFAWWIS